MSLGKIKCIILMFGTFWVGVAEDDFCRSLRKSYNSVVNQLDD